MYKSILTLDGKRFVVLPESEHRLLQAQAAAATRPAAIGSIRKTQTAKSRPSQAAVDAGDVAEALRRLADPTRIPAADLAARLAL